MKKQKELLKIFKKESYSEVYPYLEFDGVDTILCYHSQHLVQPMSMDSAINFIKDKGNNINITKTAYDAVCDYYNALSLEKQAKLA